jgi:replicative DNA helicase
MMSDMAYGRVMPQAVPLEEAVIGGIIVDKHGLSIVTDILSPDSFYKEAHGMIYSAMLDLFKGNHLIDLFTLSEQLKKKGQLDKVGGDLYLMQLAGKVGSTANIEVHARIVAQKHMSRELIKMSAKITKDAFDDTVDVFELLDAAEHNLYDITTKNLIAGYSTIAKVISKSNKRIEAASKNEGDVSGVTTGFKDLDKMTAGWQKGDLIIIAARPGMGKTAFTLALARNAAKDGKAVSIFSLEMTDVQLGNRMISMEADIDSRKLRNGKLSEEEWKRAKDACDKLSVLPITIDPTPSINIFDLKAKCKRMVQDVGIDLIIIDYLQLMRGDPKERKSREQEVSSISRSLKALAKDLDVPVIALAQLSRAVETRGGNKRPMLSDLRESGAIEQDADLVSFIYRSEYYGLNDEFEKPGETEIIISKHRNGGLGSVYLRFVKEFTRFEEADLFTGGEPRDPAQNWTIKSRGNEDSGVF